LLYGVLFRAARSSTKYSERSEQHIMREGSTQLHHHLAHIFPFEEAEESVYRLVNGVFTPCRT
jgi:hypothetical protein